MTIVKRLLVLARTLVCFIVGALLAILLEPMQSEWPLIAISYLLISLFVFYRVIIFSASFCSFAVVFLL